MSLHSVFSMLGLASLFLLLFQKQLALHDLVAVTEVTERKKEPKLSDSSRQEIIPDKDNSSV
jgi:uncharacterized RDD family membrane protein YckC